MAAVTESCVTGVDDDDGVGKGRRVIWKGAHLLLVRRVLDIFLRAANGPVDLAPKLAPGRAEREGLVSNLCISHSSEQTNTYKVY